MTQSHGSVRRTCLIFGAMLAVTVGAAQAQNAVIRGTVRSDVGEPVEGASFLIPEMAVQAATNARGEFLIILPEPRVRGQAVTLVIRMIGFRPYRRPLIVSAGEQAFDVTLQSDPNRLEDIVVTGVMEGTPQTLTTFSVDRVDLTNMRVPATDPLAQLAGRVPGVNISTTTGRPGASPDVLLRGPTSINASGRSQEPLYIVDGIIMSSGQTSGLNTTFGLTALNAQDVENIEIVKGAAGASLYGARAANGVINITTRSGRTAREGMTVRFRSEAGFSDIAREIGMARQHVLLRDASGRRFCVRDNSQPLCARTVDWATEAARINNFPGNGADNPASFSFDPGVQAPASALRSVFMANLWPVPIYNQVRQVMTSQPFVNTNLDVTGRMGSTRYMASGSQLRQEGGIRYLKGTTRYTARLNVDQQAGRNVSLSFRTFLSHATVDAFSQDREGGVFNVGRQPAAADLLARDTLGRLYARANLLSGNGQPNPLYSTSVGGNTDLTTSDRFLGGGTLRWAMTTWADLEANLSYDFNMNFWDMFGPKGTRSPWPTVNPVSGYYQTSAFGGSSYNASVTVTARHNLLRDVLARWQLRYLYERQDRHNRYIYGDNLAVSGVDVAENATLNKDIRSNFRSERLIGFFGGVNLDYRQRLIGDFLLRRDGSSLFGAGNRWATFGRASLAYRPSQESWWPLRDAVNEFKVRASYGSAGGRPGFDAQYETYDISAGTVTTSTLGNRYLRPETNTEREVGADIELFRRVGIAVTYAHSDTRDQILPVPAPAAAGFSTQWQNAGTLTNQTWEMSLNVPVVRRRDVSWSWRLNYDRTRTVVTQLDVPPFGISLGARNSGTIGWVAEGERYATIYGHWFLRGVADCARLPTPYSADCGTAGAAFQVDSDGWLVWTGGAAVGEGLSRNLWTTTLPASGAPWSVALNWGMPIALRDSAGGPPRDVALGSGLPDWRFSVSQTFQFRRLTVYALLEGVIGRSVWNLAHQWAYMDLMAPEIEQRGRNPEDAKPIGYYWRAGPPDNAQGIGGFYHIMTPTNESVEDASFAKLRELSISYRLGRFGGFGSWEISLMGRNVFTLTKYRGFDPEVGFSPQNYPSQTGSGIVNAVDDYSFPGLRTFTVALSTSF